MIGRGANLNKLRRQAEGKSKAKVPSKTIQPNIMTPSAIVSNQPTVSSGAVILEPMDNTPSLITTPQDLRNVLSPMSPVEIDNINPEPEDPESGRFLASLIAQGAAGFGAGLMGGSSQDILRATGMFDRMRESDINRQDRLGQAKLLRDERLGEKQERLAEIKKREDQAKSLTDPNSEESKRDRLLYEKVLKTKIPEEVTAFDLRNRPEIVRSLMAQAEQSRLAAMPRGGIGGAKPEKEIKSNQKSMAEYREHVSSLAEMGNVLNKIKLLNRTGIGTITPDFSVDTQAYSTSLDRAAQPMIKTLAGPGTLQKEERDTYGKLVPTGNTRADLALRQANDIIVEGTDKALSKMNADLSTGDISKNDYDALINQYNEQLSKKGIGINQIINPSTGKLETRQKREATLKDGKKVIVDQFGYTWE